MLEKVLDLKKKPSIFLTDTTEDIDVYFRYITSKKKIDVFSKWTPLWQGHLIYIYIYNLHKH